MEAAAPPVYGLFYFCSYAETTMAADFLATIVAVDVTASGSSLSSSSAVATMVQATTTAAAARRPYGLLLRQQLFF